MIIGLLMNLSKYFDVSYRKDRSCHGGGILVYINSCLIHKRRTDLEIFWDESIRVEVRINNQPHLLGIFYSTKPYDQIFLELSI